MTTDIVPAEVTLALSEGKPREIVERAKEMAETLKKVIDSQHLFVIIQGKKYVIVEGWTTLGAMVGVFPSIEWSRPFEDSQGMAGWEARCVARTPTGNVIGAAEAQCTRSEEKWASRDDYALRSMAQTRAVSKAMRVPLSWVMTLAGYEATPAEEMPRDAPISASMPAPPNGKGGEVPIAELRTNAVEVLRERFEAPADLKAYLVDRAPNTIDGKEFLPKLLTRDKCEEIIKDCRREAEIEKPPPDA